MRGPQIIPEPRHHERHPLEVRAERLQLVERCLEVGLRGPDMPVVRGPLARPHHPLNLVRLVAELGRAGDDRHRLHRALQRPDRTHDLEGELRNAVAERADGQVLKHDVSGAAIRRRRPLDAFDHPARLLVRSPLEDLHRDLREVELLAVRPDPPDPRDRPFAQRHRKARRVAVGANGRATALAPARLGRVLDEVGRPDQRPGDAHPPVHLGQRIAFRGSLDREVVEPPDGARAVVAQEALVDEVAGKRTGRLAHERADRAEHAAHGLPGRLQYKRCHQSITPGKSKTPASRRRQGAPSAPSTTRPAES